MNDSGTICHGYVIVTGNEVTLLVLLCCGLTCALIERLVLSVLKVLTLIGLENLIGLSAHCLLELILRKELA